jgi:filamentous hemagglutinin family protein
MRIEHTFASRRRTLAAGAAFAALLAAGGAQALPTGPGNAIVAGGTAPSISGGTSGALTVDLNAARTIIDWGSFNIASGETVTFAFDQRNHIALNRTTGPVTIDGALRAIHSLNGQAGGNVWIYSPAGIAFGSNARVDVGGMLATSSALNQAQFLATTNLNMTATGSGSGGPVTVAGGAQIVGRGHLAFVAPQVSTAAGATVDAGDHGTAGYHAVDSYEIRFQPAAANNDLSYITFIVPGVAAGTPHATPLNIAGASRASHVFLMAISRQQLAGLLINAPGLIEARSSFVQFGQVNITTGRNIISSQVNETSTPVVGAQTGHVQLGRVQTDGNLNIHLEGANGFGNLRLDSASGGQGFLIVANDVITGAGGLTAGTSNVNLGNLRIVAAGTVDVPFAQARTNFDIFPGVARGAGNAVTQPLIRLGTATAGGFISFTNTRAITAQSLTAGGNFTVANAASFTAGSVSSGGDILFTGTNGALDIGSTTAAGQSQMFSNAAIRLGALTTSGYTRVSANQTITATTIRGLDLDIRSAGGVTATTLVGTNSVSVGTGGVATISSITGPTLSLNALTTNLGTVAIGGDATIRTTGMQLTTSLTATNLNIEGSGGLFQLGGDTEPGLTNAEFQRIRVTGAVNLYAGLQAPNVNVPNPTYGDFEVDDLSVDPTRVPELNLFARNGQEVLVRGTISVAGEGGAIRIGDPAADAVWAPERIVITGAIGTAEGDALAGFTDVHAFEHVELYATHDILLGSQRFVDLVLPVSPSEIDIGRGLPLGVAAEGDEVGKLFVVAGNLRLTAGERIVQQNTGSLGLEGGLYLTGAGVEPDEPLLVVGGAQVADLFGAFDSGDGVLAIGAAGAFSNRIARPDGDTSQGQIRINGCLLGIGCSLSTPASQFRVQQFRPAAPRAAIDPPVLTPPPPVDDDERQAEAVITGTGNEEIWRRDPQ